MFSSSPLLPSTVNTGLSVYRNKNALSHFVVAGGKTFLFLRFSVFSNMVWEIFKDLEVRTTEFFGWLLITSHSTFMQNGWRALCLALGILGEQNRKGLGFHGVFTV